MVMIRTHFKHHSTYHIVFPENPFAELPVGVSKDMKIGIITDTIIEKLFGTELKKAFHGYQTEIFSFPPGEKSKNINVVAKLADQLQEKEYGRKNTLLVIVGGGIVGDIGGFLSSIYLRGVPFIQVPTTLLAMVDSGIGGKTGVNTKYGKNFLGTFAHPQKIIISPYFLQKLPDRELTSGLAEMVKHTVLDSRTHFDLLAKNIKNIRKREVKSSKNMIKKSIQVKLRHVLKDERENGIRAFLNFGHTIGHAIEKASDYAIPHGFAISIGMILESKIAERKLGFKGLLELKKVLELCGLPTNLPKGMTMKKLLPFLRHDKKNIGKKLTFALPQDFGKMKLCHFDESVLL
jgi:3-dehydroquinate synthase